jgi:hypothetical protein
LLICCWFTVQFLAEGRPCSYIIGHCSDFDCASTCKSNFKAVSSTSCSYHNLCTCFFDRQDPHIPCDTGMGYCDSQCNDVCCNNKCKAKYSFNAIGLCMEDKSVRECFCYYAWVIPGLNKK